ncbi:MAG: hypothetical protein C4547_00620 [Phycisphaerales bacterium]|nr:MAG: hypothetical protein C4547_00620 [Phycisphaerales bacterium]
MAAGAAALVIAAVARAETYGNTEPFEIRSNHSPNFVLGTEVEIPVDGFKLESFGLMYGHENFGDPSDSNARFALYTSGQNGLPEQLVAATGEIHLSNQQTYDNIPFLEPAVIDSGTYWMMALYQSQANPRMTLLDGNSLVAYWSNPYGNGIPDRPPGVITYTGQDFNYWVNGTSESGCGYLLKKSKPKGGCGACPAKGDAYSSGAECEDVGDCDKKFKGTIACPDGGNGTCKLKGKRNSCD